MTFSTESKEVGRIPISFLELELDQCSRVYGESPCTADLALVNLCPWSEDINQWAATGISTTTNVTKNPVNNAVTADLIKASTANSVHEKTFTLSGLIDGVTCVWSIWLAQNHTGESYKYVRVQIETIGVIMAELTLDLELGAIIGIDEGVANSIDGYRVDKFENEDGEVFWRLTMSAEPEVFTSWNFRVNIMDEADPFNDTFVGDGTGAGKKGVIVFGSMVRQGANQHGGGIYVATTATTVDNGGEATKLCYNTYGSCQDTANYDKTTKQLRFCSEDALQGTNAGATNLYPCISSVSYTPTKLQPGKGLSLRGSVTIKLKDFIHNDIGTDPYVKERSVDPETKGTFFGKMKARNEYYQGRKMTLYEGYVSTLSAAPWSLFGNSRGREYIIEDIKGPDAKGYVTITGKDILKNASDERAKCPVPSTGVLNADINDTVTTVVINSASPDQYDVDKYIRIDDEIMEITLRSGSNLTVVRAAGGTEAKEHKQDATIQACKSWDAVNVVDIVQDLLEDFAGIDTSYIPFTDWQAEETAALSDYDLTTIISEPTGVTKLLQELVDTTLIDLWYDEVAAEVKLTVVTPFTDVDRTISDRDNILAESMKVIDAPKRRISRVLMYYGIRNYAEDLTEPKNYEVGNYQIDAARESENEYDNTFTKEIFSRWLLSSQKTAVGVTSARLLSRFAKTPIEIVFNTDMKDDDFDVGEVFDVDSRLIQNAEGDSRAVRFQIIEKRVRKTSSIIQFKALAYDIPPITGTSDIIIASDQTDYNLYAALGGPSEPLEDLKVIINSGVVVRATNGNPAFDVGPMNPDTTLTIENNGSIYGHAGRGGNGATLSTVLDTVADRGVSDKVDPVGTDTQKAACYISRSSIPWLYDPGPPADVGTTSLYGIALPGAPQDGQQGGTALTSTLNPGNLTVENNGEIFGGGGGGGASDIAGYGTIAANAPLGAPPYMASGCIGGSGGRGSDGTGSAGIGTNALYSNTDYSDSISEPSVSNLRFVDAPDGNDGSESAAGAAVAGIATNCSWSGSYPYGIHTYDSGAGGDWGEAGQAATKNYVDADVYMFNEALVYPVWGIGGNGGAAGFGIDSNGNAVTWTAGGPGNTANFKGQVG